MGEYLVKHLVSEGADVTITDIHQDTLKRVANEYGVKVVGLDEIYDVPMDIYAPCALGATINDDTIPQLKARIVAGCANNQLKESRHGEVLRQKGILYAPDYVINAGGIINVAFEMRPEGYSEPESTAKVMAIYDTLLNIFQRADNENKPTSVIADVMAQEIIQRGKA